MIVATWNVNSVRARLDLLVDWLDVCRPDVVLLQETKVENHAFPAESLEDLGYNLAISGQKTYNGVAILSKSPIEDIHCGLPALGENQDARYIEAFTGGLRVASIYVPNGTEVGHPSYVKKQIFFQALESHVRQLLTQGESLVLGGDYNVAPSHADVYNPDLWHEKILCSTPERSWFRALLNQGLIDPLADQRVPGTDHTPFTWWDFRSKGFGRNAGLRIDHLLLSSAAADRVDRAYVATDIRGADKPSDHAPVLVSLLPL